MSCSQRGIGKGDRVFSLLGRVPELYIAALGTLKNGSVFSPLFSAFGPEPIKARMTIGEASVLVTSEAFYRRKIEPWRSELPSLKHVLLTECSADRPPDTIDLAEAMAAASDAFDIVAHRSRRTWRSSTSPAARPASPRARSMSMRRSWRTTSPAASRSISIRATSSGARPIPAG